jgi:hypothetical protein
MISIGYSATKKMAEVTSERYSRYLGISREEYEETSKQILKKLKGKGMTTTEIKKALGTKLKLSSIVNLMCDQGLLIRGAPKKGWKSSLHTYYLFQEYFPDIDLNEVDEENAKKTLIRQYLSSYAPVTENDIAWWTGFRKKEIRQLLESFKDDLTHVEVSDLEGSYIILLSDQKNLDSLTTSKKHIVSFLPPLDPYMMGYKDRERYLSQEHYDMVFDRSGNATSSILLNGQVIGVWDFAEGKNPLIKLLLFEEGTEKSALKELYSNTQKIGKFMTNKDFKIKESDSMIPLTKRTAGAFMSPLKE